MGPHEVRLTITIANIPISQPCDPRQVTYPPCLSFLIAKMGTVVVPHNGTVSRLRELMHTENHTALAFIITKHYSMPGLFHVPPHLICTMTLRGRNFYHRFHLTDEETEAQMLTYPRSPSL